MTVASLSWRSLPVIPTRGYCKTLIANDELGALADRVAFELPRLVERIRLIDTPRHDDEPQAVAA